MSVGNAVHEAWCWGSRAVPGGHRVPLTASNGRGQGRWSARAPWRRWYSPCCRMHEKAMTATSCSGNVTVLDFSVPQCPPDDKGSHLSCFRELRIGHAQCQGGGTSQLRRGETSEPCVQPPLTENVQGAGNPGDHQRPEAWVSKGGLVQSATASNCWDSR